MRSSQTTTAIVSALLASLLVSCYGGGGGGDWNGFGDPYQGPGDPEAPTADCTTICGYRTAAATAPLDPDSVVAGARCEGGCYCFDVGVPPCDPFHGLYPSLRLGQMPYPDLYGVDCTPPGEDPAAHLDHKYRWRSVVCAPDGTGCTCEGLVPWNRFRDLPALDGRGRFLLIVGIVVVGGILSTAVEYRLERSRSRRRDREAIYDRIVSSVRDG